MRRRNRTGRRRTEIVPVPRRIEEIAAEMQAYEEWPFEISETAFIVFQALPDAFAFDDVVDLTQQLREDAERAAGYLREFQALNLVRETGPGSWTKRLDP